MLRSEVVFVLTLFVVCQCQQLRDRHHGQQQYAPASAVGDEATMRVQHYDVEEGQEHDNDNDEDGEHSDQNWDHQIEEAEQNHTILSNVAVRHSTGFHMSARGQESFQDAQVKCENLTTCDDCAQYQHCGWCASTYACHKGFERGPANPKVICPFAWNFGFCSVISCTAYRSCEVCLLNPLCGWCPETDKCFTGGQGNLNLECSSSVYNRNICPTLVKNGTANDKKSSWK
eukprot:GILK01003653.1.p1 GENE.GILK01003653.1~~GILK01003653.1.p1  ORF type:complete len:230 (-),score=14.51 GILK01003653.1:112-801(-)